MDITTVNRMPRAAFVAEFGGIFEHTPWVAARAYAARPFADRDALHAALVAAVQAASHEEQLTLLRAHPDLAGREAQAGTLTDASVAEQASAGLDRLSGDEVAALLRLNAGYRARHGFPFVIAVRRHTKESIFAEFARRLCNDTATELAAALGQVYAIAGLRLAARVTADCVEPGGRSGAEPSGTLQ